MSAKVAVFDYGAGNVRSVQRAMEKVGADVTVTSQVDEALAADGLIIPGVGAYASCMEGLNKIQAPRIVGQRLAGGRPVLGICVGLQVLFERGTEHGVSTPGFGEWPGTVEELHADVLPHMGWNTVEQPAESTMFAGLDADTRFYFVHSFGVREWTLETDDLTVPPKVAWSTHGGDRFVAAVDNAPLWATQFHPEKSGDAGLQLLSNWLELC